MPTTSGSSAIAIPKRKRKQHFHQLHSASHTERPERQTAESPATSESMMSSSGHSSFGSEVSPKSLGKSPTTGSTTASVPMPVSVAQVDQARQRRSSFLSESLMRGDMVWGKLMKETGESLARSEHTIVDIGSEDNPRLVWLLAPWISVQSADNELR
jgi:hypothetical protein